MIVMNSRPTLKKKMDLSEHECRVLKIAKELMHERPGCPHKKAIREAKRIAKLRSSYKVASEDKSLAKKNIANSVIPEHIKENIKRCRKAEKQRAETGRGLPTATFFRGGKVSGK